MYKLYSFDPVTLADTGYVYVNEFIVDQEAHEAAAAASLPYYRIEMDTIFGSMFIFETPYNVDPSMSISGENQT